jgi:predicted DNA-binding transcriptional regulator AlpA
MTQTAIAPASAAGDCNPNKRIQASEVREICGGISDMSLWRWLNDPALNFPRPIYIGRRRYWKEADVIAWLEEQEAA